MSKCHESCIHLKIIRHGDKIGEELSETGKERASSLNLANYKPIASDKIRTQFTAYLATNPSKKNFNMTLEDFERDPTVRKVRINKSLGYNGNPEFYDKATKAGDNGEYCTFVIDSDQYFQTKDDSTYTKVAGDFAEIILEYCKIRDRVVYRGKLPKIPKEFNRLLVSHQGVLELILFKLIEQNEGRDGLKKFIKENNLEGGVDFCEGIDIFIYVDGIKLKFRDYEYNIDEKFLKRLIRDRNELYLSKNEENNYELYDRKEELEPGTLEASDLRADLIKFLNANGFVLVDSNKHEKYRKGSITVSISHDHGFLAEGTFNNILKKAGFTKKDFYARNTKGKRKR